MTHNLKKFILFWSNFSKVKVRNKMSYEKMSFTEIIIITSIK